MYTQCTLIHTGILFSQLDDSGNSTKYVETIFIVNDHPRPSKNFKTQTLLYHIEIAKK